MKYPALLPAGDVLAQLASYDAIIDVRSEAEFALDHLPGAMNCPVLNNEERIRVGTLYKQVGPFEAKKVGAALVAKNIGHHLQQHFADMPRDWKPMIYCWRGGNRSGAMAHIFARIGWPAVQLDGGYREYRRQVVTLLEALPAQRRFVVICGTTGSGKSRLLDYLHRAGAQVLDLESLAAHRGSVLGSLPAEPQPSQKMFESRIWEVLRRSSPLRPIYVESESKKIGNLRVPEALMTAMRASACVRLDLMPDHRVSLLIEDYPHLVNDTELLNSQLEHLAALHGHEKIKQWQRMASDGQTPALVSQLLTDHYDPAYLKSIEKNFKGWRDGTVVQLSSINPEAFTEASRRLLALESERA